MCQAEAYKILKQNRKKWMTITEILQQTTENKGAISRALTKLSKHNEIKRRPQNRPTLKKSAITYEYQIPKRNEKVQNKPAWTYDTRHHLMEEQKK